eukprot:Colp12_sorted_trinity150504_noHs@14147
MHPSIFFKLAGVSGALAVGLGAYGAHGFKPSDDYYKMVFQRASNYHMIHTVALLAVPLIPRAPRKNLITGGLFTAGIILFSGSCYMIALSESKTLARVAPYGGFSLIFGWLSLLL